MDCAYIPELGYGEFSRRLREKLASRHIPITGSMELTARCNLRCVHCFINAPPGDQNAQARELKAGEFYEIMDQIVDEGCLWLLLTGGEPLIRPDFLDIYTYAKKKGLLVTVFTNGTTITPAIADHLADWSPFAIEITLYGRTRKTYERITGVHGSYDKCISGIELLLDRKLPLKLKTMIMTLNKHEIWEMEAFAEWLGVGFRFDLVLNVRLDGGRQPEWVRLTPEEVVALDLADEKRLSGWQEFCDKFWGPPSHPEDLYQCGAGVGTFHVDPYGRLSPCLMSRVPSYDLRRGTFHEGWQEFMVSQRAQKRTRETPCQYCDLISLCGQCPGWAQMEYDDQEEPVPYLCKIAHLRAQALGLERK